MQNVDLFCRYIQILFLLGLIVITQIYGMRSKNRKIKNLKLLFPLSIIIICLPNILNFLYNQIINLKTDFSDKIMTSHIFGSLIISIILIESYIFYNTKDLNKYDNKKNETKEEYYTKLFVSRQQFCNNLIKIIDSNKSINRNISTINELELDKQVFSINAEWGFGKTTFIKALEEKLIEKDYRVISFDAWSNDYEEEPLKPFIREFNTQIIQKNTDLNNKKQLRKALLYLSATVNEFIRITLDSNSIDQHSFFSKLYNSQYLSISKNSLENIENNVSKQYNIFEGNIENKYLQKTDLSILFETFNDNLELIYNSINPNSSKKIIIIIDELDRCRPTFAVEFLERIKHFFNNGRFLFILAINSNQLERSVEHFYGSNTDSEGYFDRLINRKFFLPIPNNEEYIKTINAYLQLKYSNNKSFITLICYILPNYNFSLRKFEKIKYELDDFLAFYSNKTFSDTESLILSFFYSIKYCSPDLFKEITINLQSKKPFDVYSEKYHNDINIINNLFGYGTLVNTNFRFPAKISKYNSITIGDFLKVMLKISPPELINKKEFIIKQKYIFTIKDNQDYRFFFSVCENKNNKKLQEVALYIDDINVGEEFPYSSYFDKSVSSSRLFEMVIFLDKFNENKI